MESHKFSLFLKSRITSPGSVLISSFLVIMQSCVLVVAGTQCFPGLFIFGDSLVDAGNAIAAYPDNFNRIEEAPFGVEWPGHGADRFSDGRLFGDFTAFAIGHSPSSAYLRSFRTSLQTGTNFAVAGSTVLDDYASDSLSESNFLLTRTSFSMETQIQWWRRFRLHASFPVFAGDPPSAALIPGSAVNQSLHLVLIGATDYLLQYYSNFSDSKMLASVAVIVNRIAKNLETLHEEGAETILVINLPPLGCTPAFLSAFPGQSNDYDAYGCLKKINTIILRHNQLLFRAVSRLQRRYNSTSSFVYADFYESTYNIVKDPQQYGFDNTTFLKACCGVGGEYNFSPNMTCGGTSVCNSSGVSSSVTACDDPSRHLTWDGFHVSQAVTRLAALDFFNGTLVYPSTGLLPNNCEPDFTMFWAPDSVTSRLMA